MGWVCVLFFFAFSFDMLCFFYLFSSCFDSASSFHSTSFRPVYDANLTAKPPYLSPRRFSLAYMRHPSLMLECRSLMPTLTRRTPALLFWLGWVLGRPLPSVPGDSALAPLITGAISPEANGSAGGSKAKTSTIHSYHTFRSSVCRYMVTTTSPLSGTLRGVWLTRVSLRSDWSHSLSSRGDLACLPSRESRWETN